MTALRRLVRAAAIDTGPLRRHREFRLLYTGQAVSLAGSMITYVAIPFQVYDPHGPTLVVGSIGPTVGTARSGTVASVTSVPFSIVSGGAVCAAGTIALCALLPRFWRHQARTPVSA